MTDYEFEITLFGNVNKTMYVRANGSTEAWAIVIPHANQRFSAITNIKMIEGSHDTKKRTSRPRVRPTRPTSTGLPREDEV